MMKDARDAGDARWRRRPFEIVALRAAPVGDAGQHQDEDQEEQQHQHDDQLHAQRTCKR